MKIALDKFDYAILQLFTENSRMSYAEVGRRISLSPSATKERVSNLVDAGIIKGFDVKIDYGKLGYQLKVLISIKFKNDDFKKFLDDLKQFPEIINCKRVTGEACLITECVLKDSEHLVNMIDRIIPYGVPTTSIELSNIEVRNLFK